MFDFIGDIHGHADELSQILDALGYKRVGGVFAHPARRVVFLGDYIDRGPQIAEALAIVRGMVDRGAALAILGNHEFNAMAYHTEAPDRPGEYLRSHTGKNEHQHHETLTQLSSAELAGYLDWFRSLPAWLDLGEARAVHACWDVEHLARFDAGLREHAGFTAAFLRESTTKGGALYHTVEVILKGKEGKLPPGVTFLDRYGHERDEVRVRWYADPVGQTYRTYALQTDPIDSDEPLTGTVVAAARPYPASAPPAFFGHYWLSAERPEPLAPNVACLDYSVAKGGFLCAYSWDGEKTLDPGKFVKIPAAPLTSDTNDREE